MTTKDENKLLNEVENGTYIDKPISDVEAKKYQEYAKYTKELSIKKQTTIRFSVQDLAIVKSKAKESGIGYQNIIQSLVHNYATGKITLKI